MSAIRRGGMDANDAKRIRAIADDLARVARYAGDPARRRRLEMAVKHAEDAAAWLAGERDESGCEAAR